ncbi:MAG: vWA domain-containing protein [Akkermansiaceae bacterium]
MTAILITLGVAVLTLGAEVIHWFRIRRVKHLAFAPDGKPIAVAYIASAIRLLAFSGLAWSLTTLYLLPPKAHRNKVVEEIEAKERHHLLLVLDVSPSMKLQDAGEGDGLSRTKRASALIQSMLKRTTDNKLHITLVAVYNGAKPVVQESRDLEVILNFLDDIPLHQVFPTGKTRLFDGIEVAAKIAEPWPANSTTMLLVSDGDTVPSTGMPKIPSSIGGVLILGVGNPTKGSFIDGRHSRQDTGALRQIASRLGGEYHDGNIKHVPTDMLARLGTLELEDQAAKLTLREYALIICATSALLLAILPILLYGKLPAVLNNHRSNN